MVFNQLRRQILLLANPTATIMKKALVLLLLLPLVSLAQKPHYATGCLVDDESYARIPVKARQLTRSYTVLPARASLLPYCPTPGNQGIYQTCTSWAVAYSARTIMEAVANGQKDPKTNAQEAFSPTFVYALIKNSTDRDCSTGTLIEDALAVMKNKGVPKMKNYYEDCASYIPASAYSDAANYKIENYFTLFSNYDNASKKIEATKMAISEGRPVMISMECFNSFSNAKDCWDGYADYSRGWHAMCAVGYDDEKYGGAFRIMNSWGTYWGDNGFTWVTYKDFSRFVRGGYEMYLSKKKTKPSTTTFSGSLDIQLATGGMMPVELANARQNHHIYKVPEHYPSGTRYRIMLSNNEPAYVYVIGSDMTGHAELLFPPTPQISPALVYASNNIAIPDEQWYIETDNTVGTDYLCVLYSQTELPIDEIVLGIANSSGSFTEKVDDVLSNRLVPDNEISYGNSKISFSSVSKKSVVPVIVEIPHRK